LVLVVVKANILGFTDIEGIAADVQIFSVFFPEFLEWQAPWQLAWNA
jgi:hypothetical protein